MGGSEGERGIGRSSVLVRVVFARGPGGLVSLNGSFLEEVGEMLALPGVLLRVLTLGGEGVVGRDFFELALSGVAGGDVSVFLCLVVVAPTGDTGDTGSGSSSIDDVLPSLLSGRWPVVLRSRGGGEGGGVLNLVFFPPCVGALSGFESGDGVLGGGEVVYGVCTPASGGGGGARVGMGGGISSTKDEPIFCGGDSELAMVRRILKYRCCVWVL